MQTIISTAPQAIAQDVAATVSTITGGITSWPATGTWTAPDGGTMAEPVSVLMVSAEPEALAQAVGAILAALTIAGEHSAYLMTPERAEILEVHADRRPMAPALERLGLDAGEVLEEFYGRVDAQEDAEAAAAVALRAAAHERAEAEAEERRAVGSILNGSSEAEDLARALAAEARDAGIYARDAQGDAETLGETEADALENLAQVVRDYAEALAEHLEAMAEAAHERAEAEAEADQARDAYLAALAAARAAHVPAEAIADGDAS